MNYIPSKRSKQKKKMIHVEIDAQLGQGCYRFSTDGAVSLFNVLDDTGSG